MNLSKLRPIQFAFLISLAFLAASCSEDSRFFVPKNSGNYDVIVLGKPISINPLQSDSIVDAVEADQMSHPPKAVVTFDVVSIMDGQYTEKRGGPSQLTQLTEIVADRDLVRLLRDGIPDPHAEIEKKIVRIAVADPEKIFGISSEVPTKRKYRLYLKSVPKQTGSYIFVKTLFKK